MPITHVSNKNDTAAIKKIHDHAEHVATKVLKGCYAQHVSDDPQVKKLSGEYVDGLRKTLYQRAKACGDKPPSTVKGDFFISGCQADPRLRSASKPVKFDIPSSWLTKEPKENEEHWTAKDLGL